MRIAVGSDHAGYHTKYLVRHLLEKLGHEVLDVGVDSSTSCDYREYAEKLAGAMEGCDYGIFLHAVGVDAAKDFSGRGLDAVFCRYGEEAGQDGRILCLDEDAYDFENIIRTFLETRKPSA